MNSIRAITTCVDYDDYLRVTLPRMVRSCGEVLVVTAPHDHRTADLVERYPKVRLFTTNAFYRYGADFNKGAAVEEAFDELGREGWILHIDADILLPRAAEGMRNLPLRIGNLYGCRRRIAKDLVHLSQQGAGDELKNDKDPNGYFQLFHADDPGLKERRPWYLDEWDHAGESDLAFLKLWEEKKRKWLLDFVVTHLGPDSTNWHGRVSERTDGRPFLDRFKEPDSETLI